MIEETTGGGGFHGLTVSLQVKLLAAERGPRQTACTHRRLPTPVLGRVGLDLAAIIILAMSWPNFGKSTERNFRVLS
jgi:hypothetical protein